MKWNFSANVAKKRATAYFAEFTLHQPFLCKNWLVKLTTYRLKSTRRPSTLDKKGDKCKVRVISGSAWFNLAYLGLNWWQTGKVNFCKLNWIFLFPEVNFTNILLAQLRQYSCANKKFNLHYKHKKSFVQNFRTKKARVKCWWNWPLLVFFFVTIFSLSLWLFCNWKWPNKMKSFFCNGSRYVPGATLNQLQKKTFPRLNGCCCFALLTKIRVETN